MSAPGQRREIKEEEVGHREVFKVSLKCSPGLVVGGSSRMCDALLEGKGAGPESGPAGVGVDGRSSHGPWRVRGG